MIEDVRFRMSKVTFSNIWFLFLLIIFCILVYHDLRFTLDIFITSPLQLQVGGIKTGIFYSNLNF